jgi:hypothetical protein
MPVIKVFTRLGHLCARHLYQTGQNFCLEQGERLFSRPAFANRKSVRKPREKNLDPEIKEPDFPNLQSAAHKEILYHKHAILQIELKESDGETAVFQKLRLQPFKRRA